MSRDQKPRRSVMVDSVPEIAQTGAGTDGVHATGVVVPPDERKRHVLLYSIAFLLACVAGAIAIALVPIDGMF